MGIQAQVALDTSLTNPRNFINKITDLGLEVEITEPDALFRMFNSCEDPYATQAEYYSGMLKICFENPLCKELIFWGFSDDLCWMDQIGFFFPKPDEPYRFDPDMNPNPAFRKLYETLNGIRIRTENQMD